MRGTTACRPQSEPRRPLVRSRSMMKTKAIAVLILSLTFAGSSILVPFGGFDPNQFPVPQDNPPVQPAGYAFAIWGLIYLWLIGSAGIGVWKHAEDPAWDAPRLPLILSLAVGSIWLPVAAQSAEWATILIWIMLITALWAAMRAPDGTRWSFAGPLALYAGWLTAASSVSIGLIGAGYGIGPDQEAWAVIAIGIALVVFGAALPRVTAPLLYAAAIAWALIAVAVKDIDQMSFVALAALGCAVAVAFAAIKRHRASRSAAT